MSFSFQDLPTRFGGWQLGPQGVLPLAQAQGQLMANAYLPSIMRSMGFDSGGDGVRSLLQQDTRHAEAMKLAQDAEADGDNAVWYLDKSGVPKRYHQPLSAPWGITGRAAAAALRKRASAFPQAAPPAGQPKYGTMSLSEFWSQ